MLVNDGDGDAARGLKHDGIGGLALAEKILPCLQLAALHVGRDAIEVDLSLEFGLEPALERVGRGLAHLVMHEQHVLAPFDRLVARAEDLMGLTASEEAGLLEAYAHCLA